VESVENKRAVFNETVIAFGQSWMRKACSSGKS